VDSVEVSTVVYVPPEEVYDFLVDFPRYAKYSKHLEEVERDGDGSEGTRYDLTFSWWMLSYTARSEVTGLEPPDRIDWQLVRHLRARISPRRRGARDSRPFSRRLRPGLGR
jgi:uncharacterized membrane protein